MRLEDSAPEALSVGVMDGGSTDGGAGATAAKGLGLRVQRQRAGIESPLNVNVVFQLAGRHDTPDFRGVRTGRYSKSRNWLLVQAAVFPEEVTDAQAEMARLLVDAVAEAETWAKRRGIADALEGLTRLVHSLVDCE